MSKVRLEIGSNGFGTFLIDGEDVSNGVCEVTITARVGKPNVVIWGNPETEPRVEIGTLVVVLAEAKAQLREADRSLLVGLGWTPPSDAPGEVSSASNPVTSSP